MLPLKPRQEEQFGFEQIDFEIDLFLRLNYAEVELTDEVTEEEMALAFQKILKRIADGEAR